MNRRRGMDDDKAVVRIEGYDSKIKSKLIYRSRYVEADMSKLIYRRQYVEADIAKLINRCVHYIPGKCVPAN
jgi:hypothetical protein